MLGFNPISTMPICTGAPTETAVGIAYAITDWSGPTFVAVVGPSEEPSSPSGPATVTVQ